MPRFLFHLYQGETVERDDCGIDFPTLAAALADASQARDDLMRNEAAEYGVWGSYRFEITDGSGRLLATVPRGDT